MKKANNCIAQIKAIDSDLCILQDRIAVLAEDTEGLPDPALTRGFMASVRLKMEIARLQAQRAIRDIEHDLKKLQ